MCKFTKQEMFAKEIGQMAACVCKHTNWDRAVKKAWKPAEAEVLKLNLDPSKPADVERAKQIVAKYRAK